MPASFFTSTVKVEWAPASTPLTTTPTWVDITSSVLGVTTSRGRGGSFDRFSAGKATIVLDNHLGTFDPTAWYRWKQVRISTTATGPVTNYLFRGFVETISHDQSGRPGFATATIHAFDLMGLLAQYEFPTNVLSLPTQLSGARVDAVLTAIAVPSAWKSVATGYVDITAIERPTDFSEANNFNALQHIQDVTEAESGGFYTTGAGVLTFEDRYESLSRLSASPATVFSDTYSGTDVGFLYGDVVLTPPGKDYRNDVIVTPDSRNAQEASDITAGYPPDVLSRTLPMSSDGQAKALANFLLEAYRQEAIIWPENLTISVNSQNSLDEMTALELRRYCTVKFTPAGKTQQTYKVFVDSISHAVTDVKWVCRVGFSSADRWFNAWGVKTDYFIIGDATRGLIGTGKIGPH